MVRVTNYFDTQVRVPTGEDMSEHIRHRTTERDLSAPRGRSLQTQMTDQQIIGWYSKILDSVRLRYRKLRRFARYGQ